MFATIFCPKHGVTGDVRRHNVLTGKPAGKVSTRLIVGSAASAAEIHFNERNKKAFFVQDNLNFALMYRNNIEFYSFFAIEWTAKFTENIGLPAI